MAGTSRNVKKGFDVESSREDLANYTMMADYGSGIHWGWKFTRLS